MKYDRVITVEPKAWKQCLQDYKRREIEDYERSDMAVPASILSFIDTGNLEQFIEQCLGEGDNPGRHYSLLFIANPDRSLKLFESNFKKFWSWVFEDKDSRLPNKVGGGQFTPSELIEQTKSIGTIRTPFLAPDLSAAFFKKYLGSTFREENVFPLNLGPENWQPVVKFNPFDMYSKMLSSLQKYMFRPLEPSGLRHLQMIEIWQYWLSTLDQGLRPELFELEFQEVEGFKEFEGYQRQIREIIANCLGYKVWPDEFETLTRNDEDLESIILDGFEKSKFSEEYKNLVTFIHKHKEECLWEEE